MATRSSFRVAVALCAMAFAFAPAAGAAPWELNKDGMPPVPPLVSPVTDVTGTLSASERQALEAKLRDWEARTTNQLAVLVIPSTAPETIEDYGIHVADAWKIGQKGKDNGAIFIVAKDDKKMRIEVGYGFEGVLTDITSRRIIGETVAPYFKQGQFGAGINAGVDRIMEVVNDGKPLPHPGKQARNKSLGDIDFGTLFVILLVAVPVLGGILRSALGNLGGSVVGSGIAGAAAWLVAGSLLIGGIAAVIAFFLILFSTFGSRGGGWIPGMGGGGGGFGGGGGGGGGGFSGGGGGFGGGGASGNW
ncbi:MAG: TPM domain-containing protein [Casimicrobiaceae bacterium]